MTFHLTKAKKGSANYRTARLGETPCKYCAHVENSQTGKRQTCRCLKLNAAVGATKTCDFAEKYETIYELDLGVVDGRLVWKKSDTRKKQEA